MGGANPRRKFNLGPTQEKILLHIHEHSPTFAYSIADVLGRPRNAVSTTIQTLIAKGLVEYCDGPPGWESSSEKRGPTPNWVRLTKAGRKLVG